MKQRDSIHYTTRKIDGYNLPFNFIISERESGKSTAIWLDKAYKSFKENGATTLVIRRKIVHITKAYIDDIAQIINKFTDDNVVFQYAQSTMKDGIVDIYINNIRFIRICALSIDITALKSLVLLNLKNIVFDEFICNSKFGEKYLTNECEKFLEVYNTFRRESQQLKCWFIGNPYSYYNPYFLYFNVNTKQLKRGAIITDGKQYVIECYELTKELKEKILEENPLYQFDNSYTRYAFGGVNVNDENIVICEKLPQNYSLTYVFKISGKYIGLYQNNDMDNDNLYFAQFINGQGISKRRNVFCFDFTELVNNTIMISSYERIKFGRIKTAMRRREISFQSIEVYYMMEEIYYEI